jgi:predicted DNA-binding protein (UPF0251 family)
MQASYEWQIPAEPDGLVSVVVRMTYAEASALSIVDLSSSTQPDAATSRAWARPIVATIQQAITDGALVLPDGAA